MGTASELRHGSRAAIWGCGCRTRAFDEAFLLAARSFATRGSSRRWIERQQRDPYVKAAASLGLRSRASFKLQEIQRKHKIIRRGARVVDLGAAPGGWSVEALGLAGPEGAVVAVDLLRMEPIAGVYHITADFTCLATQLKVREWLAGRCADVILSDMAPSFSGDRSIDHLRTLALCEKALEFSKSVLAPGGTFLGKFLKGRDEKELWDAARPHFGAVKIVKPPASREASSEAYMLATGFGRSSGPRSKLEG